jgi:N,N'-diacetyllegionaminate synthase
LDNKKTYIIAEIGVNHDSNYETAIELTYEAYMAGADAVKFQAWGEDHFPAIEHLRLPDGDLYNLQIYAESLGLDWFCTPFDFWSIDFLAELGMTTWKIPSGKLTNEKYLDFVLKKNPEIIIASTGMQLESDITKFEHQIARWGYFQAGDYFLLECNTEYPTPYSNVRLPIFNDDPSWNDVIFQGLSDHTSGIEIPIAAVARGAKIIEKHITMDRDADGPDHKASIEPDQFKMMVTMIRNVEKALKNTSKEPTDAELAVKDEILSVMESN